MYNNSNRNSQINRNAYNLELNVLCTMDMDALEITKTNSIRKYEENAYLLGNIFSIIEENKNDNNSNNNENNNNDKNNIENNNNNNNKNNNNENNHNNIENNDIDIDINKSPQDKMDIDLDENEKKSIEEDSIKTESSNQNDLKKEIINLFDNNKIDGDEDMDPEEHLQRLIRKCNNEKNKMNEEILNEINKLYSEYKEEENLLNKKKKEFNEHNKQYENIITNLRGIKNQIDSKVIEDLTNQADAINVLPNTFKEIKYYEINDVEKINKEYPFDENSNIILCPL